MPGRKGQVLVISLCTVREEEQNRAVSDFGNSPDCICMVMDWLDCV